MVCITRHESGACGMLIDGKSTAATVQNDVVTVRSKTLSFILLICIGLVFSTFLALGTWQLKRLQWKRDLIERVEQRVHAPVVAAPDRDHWPWISADADEYRHVWLRGTFLHEFATRVQAVTELGSGFWLLTPLRCADGSIVLVNRGFISAKAHNLSIANTTPGVTVVTGLLRISEPGGGFLRRNDPVGNRWYSRDVQAIALARGLSSVAPYFVDADASNSSVESIYKEANSLSEPIGGLTVIAFHNSHLVYALTWYTLALMVVGACLWTRCQERSLLQRNVDTDHVNQESKHGGES